MVSNVVEKSTKEYLDIVDEDDNVIGKGTRKSVHERHQIHRGIHVFVINDKGEILIQQRAFMKDDRPGYFDTSVGAQVLSGESYRQAASREAKEEIGIEVSDLEEVCKYKSFSNRQREIRTLFITYHEGPFNIDKSEVGEVEFRSVEDIQRLMEKKKVDFTTGFKISFDHYLKYLKKR